MDEYIMEAFLTALKISVNDKDLPMDSSAFYANHIIPCAPEGINIDFKNSTHKKLGKFFQNMDKLGIIEYKEGKKGGSAQIVRVNRGASQLTEFEPTKKKPTKKEVAPPEETKETFKSKIVIQDLVRPRDNLLPIFPIESRDTFRKAQMTYEAVKHHLDQYLAKKSQKKAVIIDQELINIFPNIVNEEEEEAAPEEEKKEEIEPAAPEEEAPKKKKKGQKKAQEPVPRDFVYRLFDASLEHFHKITDIETGSETVKPGKFKGITMVAEKAHNKNITKITGLEQFGFSLATLSKEFQTRFASSVSTHELPGKSAGKELVVQGNFLQDLLDYFVGECKIEAKYITSQNKLEKKKKGGMRPE
eukprot:TRINITY_DN6206_c0_g1_i1.p1 TRINITY_DN6206_c0_g1~~TRINITY_DN6206_c0_g1_i1.p1  ORF type:complete len:359 (-),score=135.95 TRINITY_DN6206_c0_g1_i1:197-1273(-)